MSNIYIQEPPTTGKVVLKTSAGDLELELWTKEAPKACRNFIQLCMEGYYDNTIFHRLVKGFIVQGGDPTGTGEGGESIYGHPFKDEFHTRLRFCRRGLLAMANAGKDDNGSQFFFTLGATPELQNKHTIFGKVTGETIYNMLKLEEALVDENDRPQYPQKVIKAEIITNPFTDIEPRNLGKSTDEKPKNEKASKKAGVKNFKLLSFGEEAEEDEEETSVLNKQFSGKSKSAHDNLDDPKLSSAVEPLEPSSRREDSASDDEIQEAAAESVSKESRDLKERIKDKLSAKRLKRDPDLPDSKNLEKPVEKEPEEEEEEEEEYYLGKDRVDERKRKYESIRKEIRELKRGVRKENQAKESIALEAARADEKKEAKSEVMKEYKEIRVKYDEAKSKVPKKGSSRDDFTLQMWEKFRGKLGKAREQAAAAEESVKKSSNANSDDEDDESWITHPLKCTEKEAVLAKDASTKSDDWFEIYDPRNPLNKRRRGEKNSSRTNHK